MSRRCRRVRPLKPTDRPRAAADDAGEDDQRDAVADAVLGDQLTEPHRMIVPAVSIRMMLTGRWNQSGFAMDRTGGVDVLEQHGEAVRLAMRQRHGQPAASSA